MKPDTNWVPVVAVGMGVLIIAGLGVWLVWPEYPAERTDLGNYQRILKQPWPQTRESLSDEEIADYRRRARAMISRVLATDIPGSLICPPAAKHPIRAMDDHFDGCLFSDFQWEGDVLSCRPSYWYVKRVSARKVFRYGHVDSVVKVDFRKSPKAVIYSDRFVEIKVSEEWYPYNGVLRIPTPNAESARRLLDAFEVMGAVPVQRWPLQRWAARDPGVTRRGLMALERVYMGIRKGAMFGRGRTITAETLRFHDDYTLVLGNVTIKEDEGRTGPSTGNRVMTAREAYIRVVGDHMGVHMAEPEMRTDNDNGSRIIREKSQMIYVPLPKVGPDQYTPKAGK